MPDEEWIKTLADSRRVKFTIQELPDDRVFMTAQIESNKVVYSIILTKAKDPLTRGDVERHFEGEVFRNANTQLGHSLFLTAVAHKPSIALEQASPYSFRFTELSQPI